MNTKTLHTILKCRHDKANFTQAPALQTATEEKYQEQFSRLLSRFTTYEFIHSRGNKI